MQNKKVGFFKLVQVFSVVFISMGLLWLNGS